MPNIDEYAPGQYAVQDNSGNWISFGGDLQAAERNYNSLMGYQNQPLGSTGLPSPTVAPPSGGGGQTRDGYLSDADLQARLRSAGYGGPWDTASMIAAFNRAGQPAKTGLSSLAQLLGISLPESNQMDLDWSKEQYGKSLAENQRQFNQNYITNWQTAQDEQKRQYEKSIYTGLMQSLLGTSAQLHGQPANWLNYANYTTGGQNIFNRLLGSEPAPRYGAPGGASQPMTMQQLIADLGLGDRPATSPMQSALQASTAALTGGQQAENAQVPLPHQVNPGVWDSLSPTAKQLIMGSVQAGNTPSGVWDPNDWTAQLNASRPQGTAPRQVNYNWAQPSSFF